MREVIRTRAPMAASISADELQAVLGDLADVGKHVSDGELPTGDLSANAVALYAMQQAFCAAAAFDTKWVVHKFMHDHVRLDSHKSCTFPDWAGRPEWVREWRSSTKRWWRRPTLAAELVTYAPRMKADFEACIDGYGHHPERDIPSQRPPREHDPAERRARELVHLYLVDVVALIESKLRKAEPAAV